MDIETVTKLTGSKLNMWRTFLTKAGLRTDADAEETVLVWDSDVLVATGSRHRNLLKYIAVDPDRQGEGLLATVLTALRQGAFHAGHRHLFLYTKPQNAALFAPLFFYPVAQTGDVLLMEDRPNGIRNFLAQLPKASGENIGCAVMNCDPFTLGHQHLIETAAKSCAQFYVFVLSEDQGHFSAADRLEMVKLGTAHLSNVTVLPTGPYLISHATFPTYFLADRDQAQEIHCQLDVEIFTRYFAPALHIKHRFVGTEPFSALTGQYNQLLKTMLPQRGITVTEVPRKTHNGLAISATDVRTALQNQDLEQVQHLVPKTTFDYLQHIL